MRLASRPCSFENDSNSFARRGTVKAAELPLRRRRAKILAVDVPTSPRRAMQAVGRRRQNVLLPVASQLICRGAARQGGQWH